MVVIVDYGVGNLASLVNMFDFIGVEARSTADGREVKEAERIVLPGVGAFDRAMQELHSSGLIPALEEAVLQRKTPLLGVCLGMQLLGQSSEEGGGTPGLGWIPARAMRISPPVGSELKVPNNGWHSVAPARRSQLFDDIGRDYRFYFNHGYYLQCFEPDIVAAEVFYGTSLCCAVRKENILGVQFHPEKSHRFGMELLARFAGVDEPY